MEKLFYTDPATTDFSAKVLSCRQADAAYHLHGKPQYEILLNRTAFFPEEGGQGADSGTLNDIPVSDVQIREDCIYHILPVPLSEGETVTGHVDWKQRFDYMQQHSGEHILSGLVHRTFGYDNVGFHLGKEEVTLDFNGMLSADQLAVLEKEACEVIFRNLPVRIWYPDPEELSQLTYRSKLDLTENVRIVEIPGVDICACCAPHVESTGQIGLLKILDAQSHRGGIRIRIACGGRALSHFRTCQESVSDISVLLSVKPEAVENGVKQLKEENRHLKEQKNVLQKDLLALKVQLLSSPDDSPNAFLFTGSFDTIALRNCINDLTERYSGLCGIFAEKEGTQTKELKAPACYNFIIGSSHQDCRKIGNQLKELFHAKCGGSAPMIQGQICAAKEEITGFLAEIL